MTLKLKVSDYIHIVIIVVAIAFTLHSNSISLLPIALISITLLIRDYWKSKYSTPIRYILSSIALVLIAYSIYLTNW